MAKQPLHYPEARAVAETVQSIHQAFEADARRVLREVKKEFPEARIVSGCPADVCGLSDVDILVFREGVKEKTLHWRMAGREVNILITGDEKRKRSLTYRVVELRLMRQELDIQKVAQLKRLGLDTESAWATVLDYDSCWNWGEDPPATIERIHALGLHKGVNCRDLLSPPPVLTPHPDHQMSWRC